MTFSHEGGWCHHWDNDLWNRNFLGKIWSEKCLYSQFTQGCWPKFPQFDPKIPIIPIREWPGLFHPSGLQLCSSAIPRILSQDMPSISGHSLLPASKGTSCAFEPSGSTSIPPVYLSPTHSLLIDSSFPGPLNSCLQLHHPQGCLPIWRGKFTLTTVIC